VIPSFQYIANQKLVFGAGKLKELPDLIKSHGKNVLLIWGKHFEESGEYRSRLLENLGKNKFNVDIIVSTGEPSP
jgi:alcohol dehydrogenase YqhD (iron-dependent ADH family)